MRNITRGLIFIVWALVLPLGYVIYHNPSESADIKLFREFEKTANTVCLDDLGDFNECVEDTINQLLLEEAKRRSTLNGNDSNF